MLNQPSWFSENYYYTEKMKHVESLDLTMTLDELKDAIAEVGGAWRHYELYGFSEFYQSSTGETVYIPLKNSTGNVVFDPQVYCESKLKQLLSIGYTRISATSTWQDVAKIITVDAEMSLYDHYVQYGQAEGLSVNSSFSTEAFFKAKLAYIQANADTMPAELTALTTWQEVAAYYADRNIDSYQNWVEYGVAEGITADAVKPGGGGDDVEPIYLNPMGWYGNIGDGSFGYYTHDDIKGTDQDDLFVAYVYDDANSLNTGDKIDGRGGVDTLEADLAGNSYTSVLTPIISNVEILKFRVQEQGGRTGDNNVGARIDAERISASTESRDTPMGKTGSYTEFWSWNSRDDLLIEDVRIGSTNVVVGMQDTDPGTVDYELYFDPLHLTHEGADMVGTLVLRLLDTQSAAANHNDGDSPTFSVNKEQAGRLTNNPFDRVTFKYNEVTYTVIFGSEIDENGETIKDANGEAVKIDGVTGDKATYQTLLEAIQNALQNQYPELGLTVELDKTYRRSDTKTGEIVHGLEIVLKGAGVFELTNVGWGTPDGSVPSSGAIDYEMDLTAVEGCPLIQTNIALDNVGRVQWDDASPACLPDDSIYGSNAGDMVVGSMATRGGVERFDVYVDRGSWLYSLSSTNNTLRMIQVAAADWNGDGVQGFVDVNDVDRDGDKTEKINGQLFIGAANPDQTQQAWFGDTVAWQNPSRLLNYVNSAGANAGIQDVKLFDATDYTGNISIAAVFTAEARDKYLADVDGLRTVYKDSKYAPSGDFEYNFGSGDDTLNMLVNGGIAADQDFKLQIEMGVGDDLVHFQFDFDAGNQVISQTGLWTDMWDGNAANSGLKNVTINTGAGDDTVWAWGSGTLMNRAAMSLSADNIRDQAGLTYDGVFGYLKVETETGDDAVYTAQDMAVNNSTWVLNANSLRDSNEDPLLIEYGPVGQAQPINNDITSTENYVSVPRSGALHGVIQFLGVTTTFDINSSHIESTGTGFRVLASEINKAIIAAVEKDAQLSKLVDVFDGAGNSLLVQSLIDGRYTLDNGDFSVLFSQGSSNYFEIDGYVQQAREQADGNVGNANRVFDINFGTVGVNFTPGAVSTVYRVTIDDKVIDYTQVLSDDDWTDIVAGLQADLVAEGLGSVYEIQLYDNEINRDTGNALAGAVDQLHIVRLADDYVGTLSRTATTTLVGPAAVLAAGTYTVTVGATTVWFTVPTILGGPAVTWTDYATALATALNASGTSRGTYTVEVTKNAAGIDNGLMITETVTGAALPNAIITVLGAGAGASWLGPGPGDVTNTTPPVINATAYDLGLDPDINYSASVLTGGGGITGTLSFTLDTDWSVTGDTTYTVYLGENGITREIATYTTLATGATWNSIVDGLNANATGRANPFTITSSAQGVLDITSQTRVGAAVNPGNTRWGVTSNYDVTCTSASAVNAFGTMDNTSAVQQFVTLAWGAAPVDGATYRISFGNETIEFQFISGTGGTNWVNFAAQLQTTVDSAILRAITGAPGNKLTVWNNPANDIPAPTADSGYLIAPTATGVTITSDDARYADAAPGQLGGVPYISQFAATQTLGAAVVQATVTQLPSVNSFKFTSEIRSLEINGWTFDQTSYDTFQITLTEGATVVTLQYKQRVGDTWADVARGLNNALNSSRSALAAKYSITAGSADGTLVITDDVPVATSSPITLSYTINYLTLNDTQVVDITPENFSNLYTATGARNFTINAWNFTANPAGIGDTFTIFIDPDGSGTMGGFTLTYTQGIDNLNADDVWRDVVLHLQSQVNDTVAGRAFRDAGYSLNGVFNAAGALIEGVLQIQHIPGTNGLVSNFNDNMVVTVEYTTDNSITTDLNFIDYTETHIVSAPAAGEDNHYYGLTEVYGGAGDDVLVTGYADAIVYGGAGNDVIVVGNETYNFIYGEGDNNTIHLGARSVEDANGDVLYQGNNGNNVGLDVADPTNPNRVVNPDSHDKVFVTEGGANVIYNFDVAGTFTFNWNGTRADDTNGDRDIVTATIQSDRLYGVSGSITMGTYDAVTGFDPDTPGMDAQIGSVVLIGVGNVGELTTGRGTDEFGDYVTVNLA